MLLVKASSWASAYIHGSMAVQMKQVIAKLILILQVIDSDIDFDFFLQFLCDKF